MMTKDDCRVIGHHFLEYLYHELDEAGRFRVDRHLAACPHCAQEFSEMQATLALIDDSTMEPEEELSDQFAPTVLALIQRRNADRRGPVYTTLAAACIAMAIVLIQTAHRPSMLVPQPEVRTLTALQTMAEELDDPLLEELALRETLLSAKVQALRVFEKV